MNKITVRFNDEAMEVIETHARLSAMTVEEWIRNLTISFLIEDDVERLRKPTTPAEQLLKEAQR